MITPQTGKMTGPFVPTVALGTPVGSEPARGSVW